MRRNGKLDLEVCIFEVIYFCGKLNWQLFFSQKGRKKLQSPCIRQKAHATQKTNTMYKTVLKDELKDYALEESDFFHEKYTEKALQQQIDTITEKFGEFAEVVTTYFIKKNLIGWEPSGERPITVFISFQGKLMRPYVARGQSSYGFTNPPTPYDGQYLYSNELDKPLRVTVATESNLTQWKDYLTVQREEQIVYSTAVENTIDKFLKSLEGENVEYTTQNQKESTGRIVKNGLVYNFTINKFDGTIQQYISLDTPFKKADLETFNKLADNKIKVLKFS